MSKIKMLILVLVLAAVAVVAYNYGRGKPLLSNPFQKTLDQKVRDVFK